MESGSESATYIIDRCAQYLIYVTLVTYVPVLLAEQFQFQCREIFYKFIAVFFFYMAEDEQTGSN